MALFTASKAALGLGLLSGVAAGDTAKRMRESENSGNKQRVGDALVASGWRETTFNVSDCEDRDLPPRGYN